MYETLKAANAKRWAAMVIHVNALPELDRVSSRLYNAKNRYMPVSIKTGVPWPVIAVIHEREASQSWMANLAQGDRWDRVSTHVPRGEGPYTSWQAAAVHALTADDHLSVWDDWQIGGTLTALEKFNGLGYYNHGRPSPYVWAKTNQYSAGKYVADGQYDPNYVDTQDGCAPLLARMMAIDLTIGTTFPWALPIGVPVMPIPVTASHDTLYVQDALNRLGADPPLIVDGRWGPLSKSALRAFQFRAGILDDGKFGPVSGVALDAALSKLAPTV